MSYKLWTVLNIKKISCSILIHQRYRHTNHPSPSMYNIIDLVFKWMKDLNDVNFNGTKEMGYTQTWANISYSSYNLTQTTKKLLPASSRSVWRNGNSIRKVCNGIWKGCNVHGTYSLYFLQDFFTLLHFWFHFLKILQENWPWRSVYPASSNFYLFVKDKTCTNTKDEARQLQCTIPLMNLNTPKLNAWSNWSAGYICKGIMERGTAKSTAPLSHILQQQTSILEIKFVTLNYRSLRFSMLLMKLHSILACWQVSSHVHWTSTMERDREQMDRAGQYNSLFESHNS